MTFELSSWRKAPFQCFSALSSAAASSRMRFSFSARSFELIVWKVSIALRRGQLLLLRELRHLVVEEGLAAA